MDEYKSDMAYYENFNMRVDYMYKYRISKYNPIYREANGKYIINDWTSYSDIGKEYHDGTLTRKKYETVENNYCEVILLALLKHEANYMEIKELEMWNNIENIKETLNSIGIIGLQEMYETISLLKNGHRIDLNKLQTVIKLVLRECLWCIFENNECNIKLEFGYDYYVYLHLNTPLDKDIVVEANRRNLFIEEIY